MAASRRAGAAIVGILLLASPLGASAAPAAPRAAEQVLTWTANDDTTRYRSAPAQAVAGPAKIVFENSAATGNTTGMPHTLTFDTTTEGYNHDVNVNILASPFDPNNGRHEVAVTLTPGRYRYFCAIPGHGEMVGELVVTGGGADTTPPTVTAEVSGTRDAQGNYVGAATVTVSASDAGSGVDTVEYEVDDTGFQRYAAPVRVTAIGDHAVQFRATDKAGNVSPVGSVSFRVVEAGDPDTTAPTVTAEVSGTRDASGNYVGTALVTITATDTQSGVAKVEYSLDGAAFAPYTAPVAVDTVGAHMLHYRAVDVAGNASPEKMVGFTVVAPPVEDTTPPTVAAAVTGDRDGDGNYLGTATVAVTAADAQSGVATVQYSLDDGAFVAYASPFPVTTVGAHVVRYRATDVAGNRSAEKSVAFTVVGAGADACPDSDTRGTVIIRNDDTRVANVDTGNGCTINDLIAERASYPSHASFVRHVESVTHRLVTRGMLTLRQQGTIVRSAARSDVGT